MNRGKKTRIKSFFNVILVTLLFFTIIKLFFVPKWIFNATQEDLISWYPTFGEVFYFYKNFKWDSVLIIFLLSLINYSAFLKFFRFVYIKKYLFFYSFILVLFSIQYYYNYHNEEFFPSIMFPSFKHGVYQDKFKTQKNYFMVKTENDKLISIHVDSLLNELSIPAVDRNRAGWKFFNLKEEESIDWIKNKLKSFCNCELEEEIFILKKTKSFSIEDFQFQLDNICYDTLFLKDY